MQLRIEHWNSPLAPLCLVTDDDGVLRALEFSDLQSRMTRLLEHHYQSYALEEGNAPPMIKRALVNYFAGELDAVDQIPVTTGGTNFQKQVWKALRAIPAGTAISYGQLAKNIDRAGSARAVGAANGSNPIPIVVPCHRVIGADGTLTGFAGGISRKRWLLDHEARFANTHLFCESGQ